MMLSYCGEADITTDQVTGVDTRTVDYCEHRAWIQVPSLSSYMVLMAHSQALVLSGLLILVVAATVKHFLIGYSTDDTQFRRYYERCLDEFDGKWRSKAKKQGALSDALDKAKAAGLGEEVKIFKKASEMLTGIMGKEAAANAKAAEEAAKNAAAASLCPSSFFPRSSQCDSTSAWVFFFECSLWWR